MCFFYHLGDVVCGEVAALELDARSAEKSFRPRASLIVGVLVLAHILNSLIVINPFRGLDSLVVFKSAREFIQ